MKYDNKTMDFQFELKDNGPWKCEFLTDKNETGESSYIIMNLEVYNKKYFRENNEKLKLKKQIGEQCNEVNETIEL